VSLKRYIQSTKTREANVGDTKLNAIPNGVDIVMTHSPPKLILDGTAEDGPGGCPHLRQAMGELSPSFTSSGTLIPAIVH
jgi:hypothetical protein